MNRHKIVISTPFLNLITLVDVEISHSWILAASADYSENGGSASLYIGFLDADIIYTVEINLTI